jgi:hypothetical protein
MIKMNSALFNYYPNEAHFKFFDRVNAELARSGPAVLSAIGPLSEDFAVWFVRETACIAWYRKSELTALIADADHRLDHALVGMSAQVNAARYSADPSVSAAGEDLYIMLHSYGNVHRKPYLQEVGAVKAILAHLEGDLSAQAQAVQLDTWMKSVHIALDEFVTLFEQREAQTLEKPEQSFPEVRRGIEGVWHQIAVLVNSGAALNTSPDFAAFINTLNPEIAYLNGEFHRAKHDISSAEVSPIDVQDYTGEPRTPVPGVLYETSKGTVKLELGRDFNIAYKNNVNPGNAECIIRGKGGYKGSKTVTFIISHPS